MHFEQYTEASGSGNPFPASAEGGLLRMGAARIGGQWTHRLDNLFDSRGRCPVSLAVAGAGGAGVT